MASHTAAAGTSAPGQESADPRIPGQALAPSPAPRLENGDRLSRPEFERRYQASPFVTKAELIEGVVYIPSPVSQTNHGGPSARLTTWLGCYEAATPGVETGENATVRLDLDNEPQPDVLLRIAPAKGGQSRTSPEGFIEAAPELVAEVAASSVSYDLHVKLHVHRRAGVKEYIVWRVLDGEIDWFVLRDGVFEMLRAGGDGIHRSEVFPGLWLDAPALLRGQLARVLEVLGQGTALPEHQDFAHTLALR